MVSKELSKGNTGLLILSILEKEDMYGYQMVKELETRSNNVFSMKEGTLYPLLHLLEKQGFLRGYWKTPDNGRKRKYYALTDDGRAELKRQTNEWKMYSEAVNHVIQY